MNNDSQLLPCPFCEGPPETVVARVVGGGEFPDAEMAGDDGLHAEAYVFCHECGAQGEAFDDTVYDRIGCDGLLQQAVSAWQDRNGRHRHLYNWKQVDESAKTHAKSPDEIDNMHKQVDVPPLDDELRDILGRPCFTLIGMAQMLRSMGHDIKRRAEDEQAVSIHWMLDLYMKHGSEWRTEAARIIQEFKDGLSAPTGELKQEAKE